MAVRDPAYQGTCQIHYKDIGDYLSRAQKLQQVQEFSSIAGIADWQHIQPDKHHDWLDQRDETYQAFMPLGSKEGKSQKTAKPSVATRSYSSGIKTGGDAWLYASERELLAHRVQDMIAFYEDRRQQVAAGQISVKIATRNDAPDRFKWDRERINLLKRSRPLLFDPDLLRTGMYRPFVKRHLYFDRSLIQMIYQMPAMFPTLAAPNQVIGVTGRGASKQFSVLIADVIPDIQVIFNGQWFSRWHYEAHDPHSPDAWAQTDNTGLETVPGYRRVDNITDWCRQQFRTQYPALQIAKDDIWSYLYGLLHAPDYRAKYRNDLAKDLPRIPFASDFGAFRDAGTALAQLHLGYETCPAYELPVEVSRVGPEAYQLSDKKMSWGGTRKEPDRSVLHVTPEVTLRGIPEAAHAYVVNGRTPLEVGGGPAAYPP